jgi:hypothetical protein
MKISNFIKNIRKKSKKNIIKNFTNTNIIFIQIDNDNVTNENSNNVTNENSNNILKSTTFTFVKNNFNNLQKNIIEILSECKRPINVENINNYINQRSNLLIKNNPAYEINYKSILNNLKLLKEYFENKNKNITNLVSQYLSIWEKINETYYFNPKNNQNKRNNEINKFIGSKKPNYTPPIKYNNRVLNNNINNRTF